MTLQSAAIPYRITDAHEVEVLLVTSRGKGHWILPKGTVKCGTSAPSSAAREAFEEAGVLGRVEDCPIASYEKRAAKFRDDLPAQEVQAYPLAVDTEAPVWPEMHQRQRAWMTIEEAIHRVDDSKVRRTLEAFRTFCRH